jgi:hypothetical protein
MLEDRLPAISGACLPGRAGGVDLPRLRAAAQAAPAIDEGATAATPRGRLRAATFVAAVVVTLRAGRHAADLGYLTPEAGAGYVLGVLGVVIMSLLLLYPLRKRWRALQRWGAVRNWFRVHMILGIVGPVCIALHCGMRPGATNSRIALVAMLLVVASGIVGRYLYAQIHHGLYGSRATLVERSLELAASRNGVLVSGRQVLRVSMRSRALSVELFLRLFVSSYRQARSPFDATRSARGRVEEYLASVRKLAGFAFYERVFALWHMLHVPLFVLLLISAILHVVAVHRY